MEQQSEFVTKLMGWLHQGSEIAQGWLLSPAAWSQFALLALAVFGAVYAARRIAPLAQRMLDPGDKDTPDRHRPALCPAVLAAADAACWPMALPRWARR